ncbi:protein kinase domain-containing protein [Pendulispora albinea]|uniref:Protein kinase n=1 Tax=Pendulispora albinea TaxID=2741071 RepID=A0ABZ2M7V2_9BACT
MSTSSKAFVEGLRDIGSEATIFASRFEIEKEAGVGGMGIVYRAFDRVTGRTVALKVLRNADPSAVERFAREAQAIGELDHPAIVRYFAHGVSEEGEPYLAMEWIEGESLSIRLTRMADEKQLLALSEVVDLGRRLAGALAAAHARGIVHRDVKPSNILLIGGQLGEPKLVDFGIARASTAKDITASDTVIGTVGYMAPEQAHGESDIDGRADLFSLGCVLYRCLTNTEVFEGAGPVRVLAKLLLHEPSRASELRAEVPPALDDLIARLLAKDRAKRPATAQIVQDALARLAAEVETGVTRRRPSFVRVRQYVLGAMVLALAVGFFFLGAIFDPPPPGMTPVTPPAPAPTGITALPASATCIQGAASLYRQGLQALREAGWARAHRLFERAAELDGACPELQFRLVLTGAFLSPPLVEREQLRRAVAVRDALSERDRLVLDAWALIVASDTPREEEAGRLLEQAVALFPKDAELLALTTIRKLNLVRGRKELETELDRVRRATDVDPGYADAWQLQARILTRLGRVDEELTALEACLKVAPGAVDCMQERVIALRNRGQCGEAAAEARRWISWDPEEPKAYRQLAYCLASDHASRATVEEVLSLGWSRLPADDRLPVRLFQRSRLAAWVGDFDDALRTSDELERSAQGSAAGESHWHAAHTSLDILTEVGQAARAAAVAERAIARKDVWVRGDARVEDASYLEPMMFATQLHAGRITLDQWRASNDAWEKANMHRVRAFERWAMKWGTAVAGWGEGGTTKVKLDLGEAMKQAPEDDARGAGIGALNSGFHSHVLDAYEGRLRLAAGENARAATLLESAARACQSLDFPFLNVRAHLWLGMAKEELGDVEAACGAYRFVLERWGRSKPASVSAREAERRARILSCK